MSGISAVHIAIVTLHRRIVFEIDFNTRIAGDQAMVGKANLAVAVFDHVIIAFAAHHALAVNENAFRSRQNNDIPFAVFAG